MSSVVETEQRLFSFEVLVSLESPCVDSNGVDQNLQNFEYKPTFLIQSFVVIRILFGRKLDIIEMVVCVQFD